jgi:hypothetical protein
MSTIFYMPLILASMRWQPMGIKGNMARVEVRLFSSQKVEAIRCCTLHVTMQYTSNVHVDGFLILRRRFVIISIHGTSTFPS